MKSTLHTSVEILVHRYNCVFISKMAVIGNGNRYEIVDFINTSRALFEKSLCHSIIKS